MDKLVDFESEDHDYLFKLVVIGETGVGKTQILNRFMNDRFVLESRSTIGVEFSSKAVQTKDKKKVKIQIWDTAGQEKYKAISKVYYQGALGAMLVYDISSIKTFERALQWYEELKENSSKNIQVLLVGNKCDLEQQREVTIEQSENFAREQQLAYIETSAKINVNVNNAFAILVECLLFILFIMFLEIYLKQKEENELYEEDLKNQKQNQQPSGNIILDNKEEKKKPKKNCCCCSQAFYDLPNQLSQRKAAFGYGNKYDFTKECQNIPGPNNYNIKRTFDPGATKGPSMGLGRDQLKQGGTFPLRNGPGPGAYESKSQLSRTSYTMRAKTVDIQSYSTSLKSPGPGTYNHEATVNSKGRYTLSRFANSGANIIAPPSSKRFGPRPYETIAPGPGNYYPKNDMSTGGTYVLSKYGSNLGKTMPHCYRKEPKLTYQTTPGPGSYRLPSEFGYYEDKRIHKR